MDNLAALLLFLGSYGFLDAVKIYSMDIKSPKAIFKQFFTKHYRILAICVAKTDNLATLQLLWRPLRLSESFQSISPRFINIKNISVHDIRAKL